MRRRQRTNLQQRPPREPDARNLPRRLSLGGERRGEEGEGKTGGDREGCRRHAVKGPMRGRPLRLSSLDDA